MINTFFVFSKRFNKWSKSFLLSSVKKIYLTGLFHLMLSITFVQGLTYLSQLIVARLFSPADFGIVRSMEAILSVVILIASAGMPSLAVKSIAEVHDTTARGLLLGRLITVGAIFGLIISSLSYLLNRYLNLFGPQPVQFSVLLWVIALVVCSRTCLNYFQGIQQFQRISVVNAKLSIASLILLISTVAIFGLNGWVIGRYISELIFLACGLKMVWNVVRFHGQLRSEYSYNGLFSLGLPISLSLVARSSIDNIGIFILNYWQRPATEIGVWGLALLIMTASSLPLAALNSIALPKLVENSKQSSSLRRLYNQLIKWNMIAAGGVVLLIFILSPFIAVVFGNKFANASSALQLLVFVLPLRALNNNAGSLLLAFGKTRIPLLINLCTLSIATLIMIVLPFISVLEIFRIKIGLVIIIIELVSTLLSVTIAYYLVFIRKSASS